MFTTRHYEVVARVLKENKPKPDEAPNIKTWAAIASGFIQVFAVDNGNFDAGIFLHHCGVKVE